MAIDPKHVAAADTARKLYQSNLVDPSGDRADWLRTLRVTRKTIAKALKASALLEKMEVALMSNGAHNIVFRHLLAPPISQDQFKLLCPEWPKSSEKSARTVNSDAAIAAKKVLVGRLDPRFGIWLTQKRPPTRRELRTLLLHVSPLIASQRLATGRRSDLAGGQEQLVIDLLIPKGWTRLPSKLIDTRAAVAPKHFMHKTRFATGTTTHQEVDIACGLKATYVLALECKVSNDETNSVKRINDVIKKSHAWKEHWGNFVITAALLQGVIAPKDVQRLSDNGIEVFWSHDLEEFENWLEKKLA